MADSRHRFIGPETAEALHRDLVPLEPFWSAYSRPLRLWFPAANTKRGVLHGLGTTPDGFLVVWADCAVRAEPGLAWDATTAALRADQANGRAVVIFYRLREDIFDA